MKRNVINSTVCLIIMTFSFQLSAQEVDTLSNEFNTSKKRIKITDENGSTKVEVFNKQDSTEMKKVYEGVFSNDKTYEKWTVEQTFEKGLDLFKKKKKTSKYKMYSHWDGISLGFCAITNGEKFNNIKGISLKAIKSREISINPYSETFSLIKNHFGAVIGLGFSLKKLYFDNNTRLVNNNGIMEIESAPQSINYDVSMLRIFNVNLPFLLEFQAGKYNKFSLSAGVIGGFNIATTNKLKFKSSSGEKVKVKSNNCKIARFTCELFAQVGYGSVAIFAKYSPIGLFEDNCGPNVQTASLGLKLLFQ